MVTLVLGSGLFRLRFETGILDWLPEHDPRVQAFGRVLERLDGITNQELLWVELDPEKARALGVETIHDQTSLRAQEELIRAVRDRVPRVEHVFGLPHWFALLNQLNHGGDPEAYRIPDSPLECALIWNVLWTTNRTLIAPTLSPDGRGTFLGLMVEGNPLDQLSRDVGLEIESAVDAYKADPDKRYDLFREDILVPVGLASGTAMIDRSLREDTVRIVPLAVALLVAALVIAFRRPRVVVLGNITIGLGVIWTYGLMGLAGVPLNIVNISLVPLVFGCGVDYAIHIINEFAGQRFHGSDRRAAMRGAARTSGVGVVLTTLTTVVGLLALTLSDSPGMVQLGLFAAFGMVSLAVASLTFLPAAMVLKTRDSGRIVFPESRRLGAVMEFFGRHRWVALLAFLTITGLCALLARSPTYLMDVIEGNYAEDDPVARAVARMKELGGGAFPEFVIVEGDLTRPESLAAMETIEKRLTRIPELEGGIAAASFADVLGAYRILAGGTLEAIPAFVLAGGDAARAIPSTQAEVRGTMRAMNEDPAWKPMSNLFIDPAGRLGLIIVLVGPGWDDLEGTKELYTLLDRELRNREGVPDDLSISFLGYRTMAYLFVTQSLFWLRVLFFVSFGCVFGLIMLVLPDKRALLAVGALMITTGIWWLGLLHIRGIYISMFLLFPLIFIVCVGSDYGLHLCWRLSRGVPPRTVWRTTGKAILFSALTDGGVFALFATFSLVSASQVMESIALAVVAVFAATVILVPAVYGPTGDDPSADAETTG